ncbi:hypothetical protein Pla144_00390 [Bythopirellula polymerisocia]|uniref:Uncharacterized protein n=1 Tax=Bythopirellula polymerisocia TaxID=2528003 RepID=A0A5C6CWB0_9BACT|nr:hypothetical protein Pla144_00390 [Bythopirellula polymerisocia]
MLIRKLIGTDAYRRSHDASREVVGRNMNSTPQPGNAGFVGNRLRGSGMRWSVAGSDAVCHLRALYLSQPGSWDDFWKNYLN